MTTQYPEEAAAPETDVRETATEQADRRETAFDPAQFSMGDWNILKVVLVKEGKWLAWKASRPDIPAERRDSLLAAAERRFALARECVGARAWKRDQELAEAALERADAAAVLDDDLDE